jgi:hypothetical protein
MLTNFDIYDCVESIKECINISNKPCLWRSTDYWADDNISVISLRSVLLMEETGVSRENNRPVASKWQTLSHNVVSSTPFLFSMIKKSLLFHLFSRFLSCSSSYPYVVVVIVWLLDLQLPVRTITIISYLIFLNIIQLQLTYHMKFMTYDKIKQTYGQYWKALNQQLSQSLLFRVIVCHFVLFHFAIFNFYAGIRLYVYFPEPELFFLYETEIGLFFSSNFTKMSFWNVQGYMSYCLHLPP